MQIYINLFIIQILQHYRFVKKKQGWYCVDIRNVKK